MIHYITVGVALERPPATHEYRKYAIYGGTHSDAELTALQMAACTSVMPVSIEKPIPAYSPDPLVKALLAIPCTVSGCQVSTPEPHGTIGCRCWPGETDDTVWYEEAWQVDIHCPYHGAGGAANMANRDRVLDLSTPPGGPECPPGVHSCFDPCPGGCLNDDDSGPGCPGCGDEHGGMHMLCSECVARCSCPMIDVSSILAPSISTERLRGRNPFCNVHGGPAAGGGPGAPTAEPVDGGSQVESGETVPALLSPGGVLCGRCDWGFVGGTEADQIAALTRHKTTEHKPVKGGSKPRWWNRWVRRSGRWRA